MDLELRKRIIQKLVVDRQRNGQHQKIMMLRLTKEQVAYLDDIRRKKGWRRGPFLRHLIIVEMEKTAWRDQHQTLNA